MKVFRISTTLIIGLGFTLIMLLALNNKPAALVWAQAGSGVLRVAPIGTDAPTCGSVAAPCRTIQYAVDLANPSDEILVATGTFTDPAGTVALLTKTVILQGGWNSDFSVNDPNAYPTTLDARRMGSVISITGHADTPISPTIDGFIITQGDASSQAVKGGGLYSIYADPIVVNNIFTDNVANSVHYYTGDGGGLYLIQSPGKAIIQDNVFISNTAAITGGWGQGGAIYSEYSSPLIVGNVISSNHSNGWSNPSFGGGNGGGIVVFNGMTATTIISGNQVYNNVASAGSHGTGGGMTLGKGPMLIQNNTVRGNVASSNGYGSGGGIILSANAGPVTITDNLVENNIAGTSTTDASSGGGLFFEYLPESGSVLVQGNTIVSNTASTGYSGTGGGLHIVSSSGPAIIQDNEILSNTASTADWGMGGGLLVYNSSSITVSQNLIQGNTGSTYPVYNPSNPPPPGAGGGIAIDNSTLLIHDNTIRDNVAATHLEGQGGGIYGRNDGAITIESNLIASNVSAFDTPFSYGGGVFLQETDPVLRGNTIRDNRSSNIDGCGGGVFTWLSGPTLDANAILSNTAVFNVTGSNFACGGGMALYYSAGATMTNNIIARNQAASQGPSQGGGIWTRGYAADVYRTEIAVLHNTVADNAGEGIYVGRYTVMTLTNNLVASSVVAITNTAPASVTLIADHTLFWNNESVPISGTNSIWGDPVFGGNGDYHLSLGSAAIDTGVDVGVDHDIDGDLRPVNGIPDVGADEYLPSGCTALSGVNINGPSIGITNTIYAFTAAIVPLNATQPVSYTWLPEPESGQGTAAAGYQWTAPGVHTITLEAKNCGGIVSTKHNITISDEIQLIYLPIIMNQSTGQVMVGEEHVQWREEITTLEQGPTAPVLSPSNVRVP